MSKFLMILTREKEQDDQVEKKQALVDEKSIVNRFDSKQKEKNSG
jgi:hypothetical protein